MALFSVVFIVVARLCTPLFGSVGYILANIVNMGCRCVHHIRYLSRCAEKPVIKDISVSPLWLLYEIAVCGFLAYLEQVFSPLSFRHIALFVGIGACSGISVLLVLWLVDQKTVMAIRMIFSKETKSTLKTD